MDSAQKKPESINRLRKIPVGAPGPATTAAPGGAITPGELEAVGGAGEAPGGRPGWPTAIPGWPGPTCCRRPFSMAWRAFLVLIFEPPGPARHIHVIW